MKFDNVTIQIRHDTANNWLNKNPVLKAGEAGYDITNSVFKIGDGTTHWNDLASIQGGQGGDETDVKIITFVTADWKKDSNNNHVLTIDTGYKNNKFIANLEILKDDKKTYYSSVEEFSVSDSGIITVTNYVASYSGRFVTAKFVTNEDVTELTTKVTGNTNEIATLKTNKADKTYVDTGLADKADLSGATFMGEIKQNTNTYNAVYMGSIKDIHLSAATMKNMKTGYVYYAQAYDKSVSNTPPGANGGLVEYVNFGGQYIHVKYYSIGGSAAGEIYLKAFNGYANKWSDWHKISHAGDLDNYLKLTGGTVTGDIKDSKGRRYNTVADDTLCMDCNIDLGTLAPRQIHYCTVMATAKNRPAEIGDGGLMLTGKHEDNNWGWQILFPFYSNECKKPCFRNFCHDVGGKWTAWSCLDLDNILYKSGGTVTGDIIYKNDNLRFNSLFYAPLVNDLNDIDLATVPSGTSIHAFCASTCKGLPKDYFKGTVKITCYTHGEDWATEELLPIVADDAGKRAQRVWAKASGWSEWYLFSGTANTAGNIT